MIEDKDHPKMIHPSRAFGSERSSHPLELYQSRVAALTLFFLEKSKRIRKREIDDDVTVIGQRLINRSWLQFTCVDGHFEGF